MEFTEYAEKLKSRLGGIEGFLLKTLRDTVNSNAIPIIKKRVIGSGVDYTGRGFTGYSKDWKKKRSKKGLQTSHKGFSFTGSMFNSFKIVGEKTQKFAVTVITGMTGQNSDSRRSNEFLEMVHSENEDSNIIEISDKEFDKLEDIIRLEIEKYLDVK